jgi:hypothetical protein
MPDPSNSGCVSCSFMGPHRIHILPLISLKHLCFLLPRAELDYGVTSSFKMSSVSDIVNNAPLVYYYDKTSLK